MSPKPVLVAALAVLAFAGCQKKPAAPADAPRAAEAPSPGAMTQDAGTPGSMSSGADAAGTAATPEMQQQWSALEADVPQMIEAIESRVNTLSESKKLPANVDRQAFDGAKTSLGEMKTNWSQALSDRDAGNLSGAITAARNVQDQGQQVLAQLGMSAGG